jgi:hypothetical protein
MRKKILICGAALAVLGGAFCVPLDAQAQQPTRDYVAISNASPVSFTVPVYQNGTFDTVNIWRSVPTNATITVYQVYTAGPLTVTGTLGTVTGALGTGNGSAVISNAYLTPGDLLLFQASAASTTTVSFVRRVGN